MARLTVLLASTAALTISCAHPDSRATSLERLTDGGALPSNVQAFARHAKFIDAKISPKGTYLAAVVNDGGKPSLVFINLVNRQVSYVLKADPWTMVSRFYWVNDERVVAELVDQDGTLAAPVSRGELYAVDATGRGGRIIFGYRAGLRSIASRIRREERDLAWGHVIGTLHDDRRRVLVESTSWREIGDRTVYLYKLDAYTGVKTFVTQSPLPQMEFLTDENGEPRIAAGRDENVRPRFFYRHRGGQWRDLSELNGFTPRSHPLGLVATEGIVYVSEPLKEGFGLYAVSLNTGERKLISKNDTVPPHSLIVDRETQHIAAVEYEPDRPTYDFLIPEHPISRLLSGLLALYPNEHVRLLSITDDSRKAIVWMYSARDPGQFLLVDVEKMAVEPIVGMRPWIAPKQMAEMSAFHLAASDGLKIHGYLTLPPTGRLGPPPLVVLPHGGPHFIRDSWHFDPEVQLLASEGFAVLQVNYRGSGGYGLEYQEAGYRQWGDRIVQDIIDATRFAISSGSVDSRRICIYGASFGAYAAVQSAILAPELFRCVVGYAGIYDLSLMAHSGDIADTGLGRGYLRTAVGVDDKALKRASPVYNPDKIQARVFLIHGKKDNRAPLEHAERLKKSLEAIGRPVRWLIEPKEGHGFYDEAARARMYNEILGFLRENTKADHALASNNRIPPVR
jgi:dipeptidyl aminopeptidase/acylaminoacyl peptidase